MVMEYVWRAWESYKKNWISFAVAELLRFLAVIIIILMGVGFILSSLGISSLLDLTSPELMSRTVSMLPLLTGVSTALIFFIIAGLAYVILETGMYGMATESLRGKTRVETMFKVAKKKWLTGILTCVVVGIAAFLLLSVLVLSFGITFPIVGSIIGLIIFFLIMIFFVLIFPGIVIDNLGIIRTIEKSFNIVKKNYFKIFGLLLVYIIVFLVAFIPILGGLIILFVVLPMIRISLVFFYKRKK